MSPELLVSPELLGGNQGVTSEFSSMQLPGCIMSRTHLIATIAAPLAFLFGCDLVAPKESDQVRQSSVAISVDSKKNQDINETSKRSFGNAESISKTFAIKETNFICEFRTFGTIKIEISEPNPYIEMKGKRFNITHGSYFYTISEIDGVIIFGPRYAYWEFNGERSIKCIRK